MPGYSIVVHAADGRTFWVGDRSTRAEAKASAQLYGRDPLCAGQRFEVLSARGLAELYFADEAFRESLPWSEVAS